jgi:hypothetical protein
MSGQAQPLSMCFAHQLLACALRYWPEETRT